MSKTQTYDVNFRVVVIVGTEVQATSMEEAVQKAKELKEKDMFKVLGEYNDGSMQLISVGQNSLWDVE